MANAIPRQVEFYRTVDDEEPFTEWVKSLRGTQFHGRVLARIKNVENGNLGDHRHVGEGVWELRLMTSAGPRIYYGEDGNKIIVLGGGFKDSQQKDIERAKDAWRDYNAEADS